MSATTWRIKTLDADAAAHGLLTRADHDMTDTSPTTTGVAVVTGGASGFGRALADRCAARGFDVALLDVDAERVSNEAAALAQEHGVRSIGLRTDVSDMSEIDAAAVTIDQELGGADLVFSNVGVQQFGAVEQFSDDAWAWMLDVNVIGAARVTACVPAAVAPVTAPASRVHRIVVGARPRESARRVPGDEVRGARAGGDAPHRAGRGRDRRVGGLPVGDDDSPSREQPRGASRRRSPIRSRRTTTSRRCSRATPGLIRDAATAEDACPLRRRRRARGRALHRHPRRPRRCVDRDADARAPSGGAGPGTRPVVVDPARAGAGLAFTIWPDGVTSADDRDRSPRQHLGGQRRGELHLEPSGGAGCRP